MPTRFREEDTLASATKGICYHSDAVRSNGVGSRVVAASALGAPLHLARSDLIGGNFNLDHAAIGSAGVFTVETKTESKPNGDARVKLDGENILVAGFEADRNPVIQARAQAKWLGETLEERT